MHSIPADPVAVTPQWLTQVLRDGGALQEATVTAVIPEQLGTGRGFTGTVLRLRLDYDQEEQGAPGTLVAKFPNSNPTVRAALHAVGFYEREIGFYTHVAPASRLRTPRCYYSALDATTAENIILLEEISDARPGDNVGGCTPAEAELIARELAAFQGAWWDHPRLAEFTCFPLASPQLFQMIEQTYTAAWDGILAKYRDQLPGRFLELGSRFRGNVVAVRTEQSRRPWTIVHGDFRLDNMLFGATGSTQPLAVVDWQRSGRERGPSDLAYFMAGSLPTDVRRAIETRILETYYGALTDHGVGDYSLAECRRDYRLGMLNSLYVAVRAGALLDLSSPRGQELFDVIVSRCLAALEDHRLEELLVS